MAAETQSFRFGSLCMNMISKLSSFGECRLLHTASKQERHEGYLNVRGTKVRAFAYRWNLDDGLILIAF